MRIVVINWNRRKSGGVESYIAGLFSAFVDVGHDVAFLYERDEPLNAECINVPAGCTTICVAELGVERALAKLRGWQPDVLYIQKVLDVDLEAGLLSVAPSVYFAHDYQGMCISGNKSFKQPVVQPCQRTFGWPCLLHYYPHRCGGINPVTMLQLNREQSKRRDLLQRYRAVVTHTEHMRAQLVKHRVPPERVHKIPFYVQSASGLDESPRRAEGPNALAQPDFNMWTSQNPSGGPTATAIARSCRLLFSGRMEFLKGGHTLLAALPAVLASLKRPLHVTFVGDGRERRSLESRARLLHERHKDITIEFSGWLSRQQVDLLLKDCELLALPSLWPEPFGMVGPEAGQRGVPVAAFDVGGIGEWLVAGVNGYLAPGDPPTPQGLAEAIIKCLHDPIVYARLRRGAVMMAERFALNQHLAALLNIFAGVIQPH